MKLHALALATGLMMAGGANAITTVSYNLANTDDRDLGMFGAPTTWIAGISVSGQGTIDHSLRFNITTPLYAGSGVSDVPLSFGSFTLTIKDITSLTAAIYDNNRSLYTTFVQNGDADHLTLPASSFFAVGDYTLKIGGNSVGTNGAVYTIAAVTVAVPEPETWAMLLAGLGMVGLQLRRKAAALL